MCVYVCTCMTEVVEKDCMTSGYQLFEMFLVHFCHLAPLRDLLGQSGQTLSPGQIVQISTSIVVESGHSKNSPTLDKSVLS